MKDFVFAGGTAVVTGAGSGIGRALAHALAARGSGLVLIDRVPERLARVEAELGARHPGVPVRTHLVDLADREATAATAGAVLAEHPRISLLVNCAGVALMGRLDQNALEEFWEVMDVNLRAPVHLTHALLPALKASPGSHVANVSSVFGLAAVPRAIAYCTSKFAVRGFTDALRAELRPAGIGVTSVHPGGTKTRIARDATPGTGVPAQEAEAIKAVFDRVLTLEPEQVAEKVLRAVEHRRPRVLVGLTAKGPDLLSRVAPGGYTHVMAASEKVLGVVLGQWLARRRRR
ncbi:SDR family oxidoreductase [Quadrisphaera sp. DSM 44207]|uniref:SDR family NAD(P)-dependent oxidoreductase n=1 Tax=Quadrisphaera sp. DSM 44207 TaxID=1881057 RepID=UPI00088F1A97|nr:SDR family NAD(P)-dependent oxidoreductase [Quadrisphaera sp. DSM 44207]SDQ34972.1 Short-chain dehydrogenase [Quadrisphaera sp. DSM 44207]